ncbi:TPA: very short patch repair endonuclease [Pseudomonas aeruginosa]|nr:DNA mismatch endonuclease Vsr [Pseudomonas aeruginosa]
MDRLSVERRSWLMSRVKGKNTAPELVVRRLIFGMGYRYRLHLRYLPGRPDLAFLRRRKVIFVNGCFWHGHPDCRYGRLPKTRLEYWQEKIERNKERDAENIHSLEADGWQVLTVWQCELRNIENLREKLRDFLEMGQ